MDKYQIIKSDIDLFNEYCLNGTIFELLDDSGIKILKNCDDCYDKVFAIITSRASNLKLFDNESFLELITSLNIITSAYASLRNDEALKFIRYLIKKNKDDDIIIDIFGVLDESVQEYVVKNINMHVLYPKILVKSKGKSAKIILDSITSLEEYSYDELFRIFSLGVHIPTKLLDEEFTKKLSTMIDVQAYRFLINKLKMVNDVSRIETKRKEFYKSFLDNYKNIIEELKQGKSFLQVLACRFNFFDRFDIICGFLGLVDSTEEKVNKFLDIITTDIVIDYLFEDIPYNVLVDIQELLKFAQELPILSQDDIIIYKIILSLDKMHIDYKIKLLKELKDIDMISKFYDDYLKARNKMVELINKSILNKENIGKYKNEELSQKCGVPVYVLEGSEFYVLAKSLQVDKSEILDKNILSKTSDGASFTLDHSDKLKVYADTKIKYCIAYSGIPFRQLVHVFETDSYSHYCRNLKTNLPKDTNGTNRINRLYTPKRLIESAIDYDELVIAEPRGTTDEFDLSLNRPEEFAIYCYDDIADNDVVSAKENSLGIILVRTNCYSTDCSGYSELFSANDNQYVTDYNDNRRGFSRG